jgi:hypothetical protein
MKLDKDPFMANMNMVELDGKTPGLAISGQVDQGQGGHHTRRTATEDD